MNLRPSHIKALRKMAYSPATRPAREQRSPQPPSRWQRFKAFLSYTVQRMGGWLWFYLSIIALFYGIVRPIWWAVIVHAATTAWGLFGSWLQYKRRN